MNMRSAIDNMRYPIADNVRIGSIVITQRCWDVGFVVGVSEDGAPTKIYARFYDGVLESNDLQYGGIDDVTWYDTGIRMSISEWANLSIEMSAGDFYSYWRERLNLNK